MTPSSSFLYVRPQRLGSRRFSNVADQCLYRHRVGQSDPEPLTPAPLSPKHHLRYSNDVLDQGRRRWIGCVKTILGRGLVLAPERC
jgi:hypothetical protein